MLSAVIILTCSLLAPCAKREVVDDWFCVQTARLHCYAATAASSSYVKSALQWCMRTRGWQITRYAI